MAHYETLEQINALKELVQKTYEGLGYDFYPHGDYVLVRVIPKQIDKELTRDDGRRVKLYSPQSGKINKPNWEGQVLRVYPSKWQFQRYVKHVDGNDVELARKEVLIESSVKIGDHILFPHFAMVPIPELCYLAYWKNGEYGIVEEKAIVATVEYTEESDEDKLKDFFQKYIKDRFTLERATRDLMEKATVMFGREAKTTSGV